jgi:inner membrane protein YidH
VRLLDDPWLQRPCCNERTFLAWLRTGIAVIAFGFVVEKFNLFAPHRMRLERLSGSLPQGAGLAFIAVGVITIVLATIRYVRTGWLLDDTAVHTPSILPDLTFSVNPGGDADRA